MVGLAAQLCDLEPNSSMSKLTYKSYIIIVLDTYVCKNATIINNAKVKCTYVCKNATIINNAKVKCKYCVTGLGVQ